MWITLDNVNTIYRINLLCEEMKQYSYEWIPMMVCPRIISFLTSCSWKSSCKNYRSIVIKKCYFLLHQFSMLYLWTYMYQKMATLIKWSILLFDNYFCFKYVNWCWCGTMTNMAKWFLCVVTCCCSDIFSSCYIYTERILELVVEDTFVVFYLYK